MKAHVLRLLVGILFFNGFIFSMEHKPRIETFIDFPQEHAMPVFDTNTTARKKIAIGCLAGCLLAIILYYKYPTLKKRIIALFNAQDKNNVTVHEVQEDSIKNRIASFLSAKEANQSIAFESQKRLCHCQCVQRLGYCPCIAQHGVCHCG